MNGIIETLNHAGDLALGFAWPMLWQSSLLIALLCALDFGLRRKLRPAVRYAFWLLLLLKLVLPPSLTLPTAPSWWLRTSAATKPSRHTVVVISYNDAVPASPAIAPAAPELLPAARLSPAAIAVLVSALGSAVLLAWLVRRWREVTRAARQAPPAPDWLRQLMEGSCRAAGVRGPVPVRRLDRAVSPAVCGLVRPVVLVPGALVDRLAPAQARAILLHELIHLRRGDVWLNCLQTLLQIVYWWHPLLWLANARIRAVREEAVDEAVMLALRDDAGSYAPTLLEVARLALPRPLASLGLLGILESQRSLRRRIERLLDFCPPRKAGLTLGPVLCVLALGTLAVPMGEGPAPSTGIAGVSARAATANTLSGPAGSAGVPAGASTASASSPSTGSAGAPAGSATANAPSLTATPPPADPATATNSATPRITSNAGRWTIYAKLDRIRLDSVAFDAMPLREVLRLLEETSKQRDAEGTGVAFRFEQGTPAPLPSVDPTTGLPTAPPAERVDVSGVTVTIRTPLVQVRLADVLEAIVKAADKPIKYSITDDAVIFSARSPNEDPLLYTRLFKVDPHTFARGLSNALGLSATDDARVNLDNLKRFFANIGVELAPPKAVFFNDREGALIVRATRQDLDKIGRAVQAANVEPPHVSIKVRFIAVADEAAASFWTNREPTKLAGTNLTTILAPSEADMALKALRSVPNAEMLSEMNVTTLSGRQAQVQVVDSVNVITNINPRALTPPGITGNDDGGLFLSTSIAVGPTIDVLPHVDPDGWTIRMTLMATLNEFLGYDQPSNSVLVYVDGRRREVPPPLPRIWHAQVTQAAKVRDGETVVLGGIRTEKISTLKSKVPVLGDVPLVGRLFRSETKSAQKRQVLVFVTPTLVDPTGKRIDE